MISSGSLQKFIALEMIERKVKEVFGNWTVKVKMGKGAKGENVEACKTKENPKNKD